jgi:predicted Zn finger-like uncharacterized protein
MNVTCTHCDTVFRVDPRKIPDAGVRARCSECRQVFRIAPEGRSSSAADPAAVAAASAASGGSPQSGTGSAPSAEAPRFGGQDPHARARRLARALVSDMITYHPDRHQRGLREGTLRQ